MKSHAFIILALLLVQMTLIIADDKPALKSADEFVALLNDIQKELNAEKRQEDQGVCENKIRLHVRRLKTFSEQRRFAYISYHFAELYRDIDDSLFKSGYRCAFFECLSLMAKDKSVDALKAFQHMKAHLRLDFYDGGFAHDFESAMRAQADPELK